MTSTNIEKRDFIFEVENYVSNLKFDFADTNLIDDVKDFLKKRHIENQSEYL